ncbi:DUF6942 family protein [Colwellia sp. RE-S-Sl-9]
MSLPQTKNASEPIIGLGNINANLRVYIENIPPLPQYQNLTLVNPMQNGDIQQIGQLTGNHWRKIFNVFAKLLFEYHPEKFVTWQNLRDESLLQKQSNACLLFSGVTFEEIKLEDVHSTESKMITIIMGKTYANKLGIDKHCYWLSESFAINATKNIIICPYFDYRQLSNIKITQLVQLIKQLEANLE